MALLVQELAGRSQTNQENRVNNCGGAAALDIIAESTYRPN